MLREECCVGDPEIHPDAMSQTFNMNEEEALLKIDRVPPIFLLSVQNSVMTQIEDISKCSVFVEWLQFLLQLLVEFSSGASNRVEEGMSLMQQAPTGSSLNSNAEEGAAQSPSTTVVADAIPGQQSVKWFRGGPASSLIDKSKTQRSSKIEILKQLKYHVDIEKEKV
jgi:hypothetical protein